MRISFIVPYVPNLIRVRPYHFIRGLSARGHEVTVYTLWSNEQEREDAKRLESHCHEVVALQLPTWRPMWNCARAVVTRMPLQAAFAWQPELAREFDRRKHDGHSQADIVHVEHLRGVRFALHAQSHNLNQCHVIPVIWDSVDCISYLFEQAATHSRSTRGQLLSRLDLNRTRAYEASLLERFDRILVTSANDKKALEALAGGVNGHFPAARTEPPISVLENGVDLDYFSPVIENRKPATIAFTGKMSYHANVTAGMFLVNEIMPYVWQRYPEVRVEIVGKDPAQELRALQDKNERVMVTGTVPDIRPYLQRATLSVSPLLYGAGIQNKVLEAMACATPVVATQRAVSALSTIDGEHLLVADDAELAAEHILRLLGNTKLQRHLGNTGRRFVERHHNWNEITVRLEEIYEHSIAAHRKPLYN